MSAPRRIVVTGGAGYIGSHVVLELLDQGREVVVVDDLSSGRRRAVPRGVPLEVGDVGDAEFVNAVLRRWRPNAVMHFAGSISVAESVARPALYYRNNTAAALCLVDCCLRAGVDRFVFSSTAAVYGARGGGPVAEDAPLEPISPYGRSKLMVERALADMAGAEGLSYAALRYFNVAGADPRGRSGQSGGAATHLVRVACEAAVGKRGALSVYGRDYPTRDGTCVRDYVHVADLARAHVAAVDAVGGGRSLVLNCGSGRGASVLEVVSAVERAAGRGLAVEDAPRRPGDPPFLVADPGRIGREFGWRPLFGLDDMVADALEWERRAALAA
jgi:UDP-glucose 4-epimerase